MNLHHDVMNLHHDVSVSGSGSLGEIRNPPPPSLSLNCESCELELHLRKEDCGLFSKRHQDHHVPPGPPRPPTGPPRPHRTTTSPQDHHVPPQDHHVPPGPPRPPRTTTSPHTHFWMLLIFPPWCKYSLLVTMVTSQQTLCGHFSISVHTYM